MQSDHFIGILDEVLILEGVMEYRSLRIRKIHKKQMIMLVVG